MARIRSRTLVLLVALSGVAALLAAPARAAVEVATASSEGINIVSPADRSQLPAAGNGTVLVELSDRLETSSLHVVLLNTTTGLTVDLTGRLIKGQFSATASFGPSDLAPGITRVSATASRDHGNTVRRAVSVFSWEPGIDAAAADRCELLGQDRCLLPFPSDRFTVADASTDTGRRVDFNLASMPANTAGVHIDPTEWNRSDGFSPGAMIIAHVPGVDLGTTGAAPETDIARSLDADAPIVLVNADTGEHQPFFAELDSTATSDASRALIIRPARNLNEGGRYIVALRRLKNAGGATIQPSRDFQVYRDHINTFIPAIEQRRPHLEQLFRELRDADVGRSDLYLAWDFTVASERSLSERVLHIRDDAFASLQGGVPSFTVDSVERDVSPDILRRVTGTFQVPNYLTGTGAPGSRYNYGPDGLPARNGTFTAKFLCIIPRAARTRAGTAVVYGHGLLGSRNEVNSFGGFTNLGDITLCGTDIVGMASEDVGNVVQILQDNSKFATLADRLQQAILNYQFLARLMKDGRGFASSPAFQVGSPSHSAFNPGYVAYNGNSQGGIFGGAVTAVSKEWTRAVLGVPGMNYSTLLNRSVDYDQYAAIGNPNYPDEIYRQVQIGLTQMLWDRGEGDGYAAHLTNDPLPGTPRHEVLLIEAFGDHQVTNIATETEARTADIPVHQPALLPGRSTHVEPLWNIRRVPSNPHHGSALVMWDYGTPAPPDANLPNRLGQDPHGAGGREIRVGFQALVFLVDRGFFVDVCGGGPCTSDVLK
jgi:hypothetical protein